MADGVRKVVSTRSLPLFWYRRTGIATHALPSSLSPTTLSSLRNGQYCLMTRMTDITDLTKTSSISYSQMTTGQWTIIIQAPDFDFTVQRQFNLTVGAANTVVVTVSCGPPLLF
jgi:hypothetical protein